MDYEGVNSVVCDAEENDWLDISYSERKYVDLPAPVKQKRQIKWGKPLKIVAVVTLCVALLAATLFIDGDFGKQIFQTAKAAFSSSIFNKQHEDVSASIAIPANANLVDVEDGVATFNGGRLALAFADGTVTGVTETSVTVAINENTSITYDGLTDIYVAVGDVVSACSLLGKYDGTFTASIAVSGETVIDVVGSETQLTWNV